jgi:hypothetical protein
MGRFFYARIESHELHLYSDSPESVISGGVSYSGPANEAASETGGTTE